MICFTKVDFDQAFLGINPPCDTCMRREECYDRKPKMNGTGEITDEQKQEETD